MTQNKKEALPRYKLLAGLPFVLNYQLGIRVIACFLRKRWIIRHSFLEPVDNRKRGGVEYKPRINISRL